VSYLALADVKKVKELHSELYYRNKEGHAYADDNENKTWEGHEGYSPTLPIFKNKAGKRLMLPE
jgi:hypothetical protein